MKIRLLSYFAMASAVMAAFSCTRENSSSYEEGLPVTAIKMSITAPGQDDVVMTRATEEVESTVEKIAIFFYKQNDESSAPIVTIPEPKFSSSDGSNYKYDIDIPANDLEEMRSGKWYMYAVANYDKGFFPVDIEKLRSLTRTEFLGYCVTKANSAIDILETSVLMSGKYCDAGKGYDQCDGVLDIRPGENVLKGAIHLRRAVSKITFNFINGDGVTFTPESYGIYKYSRSETLMERCSTEGSWTGWKDSFPYMGDTDVEEADRFRSREGIAVTGRSLEFYMPENAQTAHTRDGHSGTWTYFDREVRNSNGKPAPTQDEYNSFMYAPENATFVVVKGAISIPGKSYSGDVTYTIHLGDFSKESGSDGNFTVRRNSHYTYNVTVKGVDNIVTEAQVKDGSEIQPGAEGNITHTTDSYYNVRLDSHFETVLLKVKSDVQAGTYAVRINSPYSKNMMVKYAGGKFDSDISGLDYGWIRFAKPSGTSGYKSYPGVSNTADIFGLLADLASSSPTKTYWSDVSGGYRYTIAYVNEYYYEDKMAAASTNEEKARALDEFINADDRTMSVILGDNIHESPDGHSTYTDLSDGFFNITQRSIKTFYNLDVDNPFGIEQIEETAATSTFGGSGTDQNDGYKNLPSDLLGSSWSDYVTNGFNGSVAASSTAIYQCLSRNRDENGDGIISTDEIKWYLPSVNQCTYYWYGMNSLVDEARIQMADRQTNNYWNSTSDGYELWWAAEGSAYGASDGGSAKVRCVRNLKSISSAASDVSSYDSESRTITLQGMDTKSVRPSGTVTGEYAKHYRGNEIDVLPKSFKVASDNLSNTGLTASQVSTGSYCGTYSEETDGSDKGKWRIPNEKELSLMLKWMRDDATYGKNNLNRLAAKTLYKRHDSDKDMVYYILNTSTSYASPKLIITTSASEGNVSSGFKVRCVRDVENQH